MTKLTNIKLINTSADIEGECRWERMPAVGEFLQSTTGQYYKVVAIVHRASDSTNEVWGYNDVDIVTDLYVKQVSIPSWKED